MGLLLWGVVSLALRGAVPAPVVITSSSKQITVRGARLGHVKDTLGPQSTLLLLDPALVAVMGERIRQTWLQELNVPDEWHGPVFVELHPIQFQNEPIVIQSVRSPEGWSYRLDMPDEVDAPRLVRAFLDVFLLEFANRRAADRSVELPPWLGPGLAAHLQSGPLAAVALSPNRPVVRTRVRPDPLETVRTRLQTNAALTVDQLNWPLAEQLNGPGAAHYEACAHLFVRELLRLRGGPDALREMLALQHQHLNWQTAFLRAFQERFPRLLDVEKWWSLVLANLTGRDTSQVWPLAESRQRLDEILFTPVRVRLATNDLPHESQVPLQTVLTTWHYDQQFAVLRRKITQLRELRPHLAPEAAPLADAYRQVLETYLRARDQNELAGRPHLDASARTRAILQDALDDLDRLDARRQKLWKTPARPPSLPSGRTGAGPRQEP